MLFPSSLLRMGVFIGIHAGVARQRLSAFLMWMKRYEQVARFGGDGSRKVGSRLDAGFTVASPPQIAEYFPSLSLQVTGNHL
jgi:hypothetical protein